MSDGAGCKCAAYSESECACDADWTPIELVKARAELKLLRKIAVAANNFVYKGLPGANVKLLEALKKWKRSSC